MSLSRTDGSAVQPRVLLGLALAAGLALGACTGTIAPEHAATAGLGCVDDSPQCVSQRQAALKTLMADTQRKWVREPASPQAYASGVRLFAFKQRKRELNCDEIGIGVREATAAPTVLRGPSGAGLTPAQVSRGLMFAEEVSKELSNEQKKRCKV